MLPFYFVSPPSCAHLATGDVFSVSVFERLALFRVLISLSALLSKTNELDLVSFFGENDVRLLWVIRCSLGFVYTLQPILLQHVLDSLGDSAWTAHNANIQNKERGSMAPLFMVLYCFTPLAL